MSTDTPQGYKKPNFTMTPNAFFPQAKDMSEAELRVMLHAIRKTCGWRKDTDPISLSQFEEGTGMSRQGCLIGIDAATARGVLECVGIGKRGVKVWRVRFQETTDDDGLVNNVDQSTTLTRTSQPSRPELVNQVDTQKKDSKETTKKKEKTIAPATQDARSNAPLNSLAVEEKSQAASTPVAPRKERKNSAQKKESAPRPRNPVFDALAQHLFGVASDDAAAVKAIAPRVGLLMAFASSRVTPDELPRFVTWYRKHNPKAALPLDNAKFAKHWVDYERARDAYAAQQTPSVVGGMPVDPEKLKQLGWN